MKFKYILLLLCLSQEILSILDPQYKIDLLNRASDKTVDEAYSKSPSPKEYIRYKAERILQEKSDDTEAINQLVQVRALWEPQKSHVEPLLSILLHNKDYDLANTLLENKYFDINKPVSKGDGFNVLYFLLYTDANNVPEPIRHDLVKILIDHGATWDSWTETDYIIIKKFMKPLLETKEWLDVKKLLEQPAVSKQLFFGKNGNPVAKNVAPFFQLKPRQEHVLESVPIQDDLNNLAKALANINQQR